MPSAPFEPATPATKRPTPTHYTTRPSSSGYPNSKLNVIIASQSVLFTTRDSSETRVFMIPQP